LKKQNELLIIQGANHGNFSAEQSLLAFGTTVDFIRRHIGTGRSQTVSDD
jgi:hypothetical protein